ncbi:essential MCU regulator, mitochondrial-like [Convolutriloba macropyga]|uniref:essential MCU regulator, mitochondrial-like n=1 Tax=Convolutriloba macropyga TaxID=536237 RepID=UPI003F523843
MIIRRNVSLLSSQLRSRSVPCVRGRPSTYTSNTKSTQSLAMVLRRHVTTVTGGIASKPDKLKFGAFRVFVVFTPLIYLGGYVSKEGAAFLEEKEIFIPEGDDDDDDE